MSIHKIYQKKYSILIINDDKEAPINSWYQLWQLRCTWKRKKKTCTSGLSYSTCVISETGQPAETSRVSPTYVSGIVVGDRKPKSHHVNPGNICTRSESDQITKENWPRQFQKVKNCALFYTSHKRMQFLSEILFPHLSMVVI